MSEFQYYEFVAIDRPLSAMERNRLRAITSRATITSTRLVNSYEWGNFKADPRDLVAKCFDAFLYYANWGTRRLILRVPSTRLDPRIAKRYLTIRSGSARNSRSVATVTASTSPGTNKSTNSSAEVQRTGRDGVRNMALLNFTWVARRRG